VEDRVEFHVGAPLRDGIATGGIGAIGEIGQDEYTIGLFRVITAVDVVAFVARIVAKGAGEVGRRPGRFGNVRGAQRGLAGATGRTEVDRQRRLAKRYR